MGRPRTDGKTLVDNVYLEDLRTRAEAVSIPAGNYRVEGQAGMFVLLLFTRPRIQGTAICIAATLAKYGLDKDRGWRWRLGDRPHLSLKKLPG